MKLIMTLSIMLMTHSNTQSVYFYITHIAYFIFTLTYSYIILHNAYIGSWITVLIEKIVQAHRFLCLGLKSFGFESRVESWRCSQIATYISFLSLNFNAPLGPSHSATANASLNFEGLNAAPSKL